MRTQNYKACFPDFVAQFVNGVMLMIYNDSDFPCYLPISSSSPKCEPVQPGICAMGLAGRGHITQSMSVSEQEGEAGLAVLTWPRCREGGVTELQLSFLVL